MYFPELRFFPWYRPFVCRIPAPASLGLVCSHSVDFTAWKTVINCFSLVHSFLWVFLLNTLSILESRLGGAFCFMRGSSILVIDLFQSPQRKAWIFRLVSASSHRLHIAFRNTACIKRWKKRRWKHYYAFKWVFVILLLPKVRIFCAKWQYTSSFRTMSCRGFAPSRILEIRGTRMKRSRIEVDFVFHSRKLHWDEVDGWCNWVE